MSNIWEILIQIILTIRHFRHILCYVIKMTVRHLWERDEKMPNKVDVNKSEKRKRIEDAAMRLFAKGDFRKISVDQIAQEANVAKGTFYLYFHDKVQLFNHLIVKKSSLIIDEALRKAREEHIDNKIDELLFLIDYVIEYFKADPESVKMIQKNLSWSMIGGKLCDESYEVVNHLEEYMQFLMQLGYEEKEAYQLIFMILELVSTVSYTSIVLKQPDSIDHLKPMLYATIRKMIER